MNLNNRSKGFETFSSFKSLLLLHAAIAPVLLHYRAKPVLHLLLQVATQILHTSVSVSTATGSTTFNGLVRAAMMPRIFGMRASAIPFWQLTTSGSATSTVSSPPSISRLMVAVVPFSSIL